MKFGILLLDGPYQREGADSAYNFIQAALKKGHEFVGVFFYHDGVYNATDLMTPPQDDRHISKRWSDLGVNSGIDIIACIAAAKRRGMTDGKKETDGKGGKGINNICEGVRISGLGQLTEIAIQADRLVTFGG